MKLFDKQDCVYWLKSTEMSPSIAFVVERITKFVLMNNVCGSQLMSYSKHDLKQMLDKESARYLHQRLSVLRQEVGKLRLGLSEF